MSSSVVNFFSGSSTPMLSNLEAWTAALDDELPFDERDDLFVLVPANGGPRAPQHGHGF